jgi:hypothetical protein
MPIPIFRCHENNWTAYSSLVQGTDLVFVSSGDLRDFVMVRSSFVLTRNWKSCANGKRNRETTRTGGYSRIWDTRCCVTHWSVCSFIVENLLCSIESEFCSVPEVFIIFLKNLNPSTQLTPWPESASELCPPSKHRLSAKLGPTFADRGYHVVSVTDPSGCILDFLDRSRYFFFQVVL